MKNRKLHERQWIRLDAAYKDRIKDKRTRIRIEDRKL
jgi:hypothetical protein